MIKERGLSMTPPHSLVTRSPGDLEYQNNLPPPVIARLISVSRSNLGRDMRLPCFTRGDEQKRTGNATNVDSMVKYS